MTELNLTEAGPDVQRKWVDSPETLVLYSNSAQVQVSTEDAAIVFGVRDMDNALTTQVVARVYLSLPHAKRLALALANSIANLEANMGEIDAHPGQTVLNTRKAAELDINTDSENGDTN